MTIMWGLSVLDERSHAVDTCAHHPAGIYLAQCGKALLATRLCPWPHHDPCEQCTAYELARWILAHCGQAAVGEEHLHAVRWLVDQLSALADEVPSLDDAQLRERLRDLLDALRARTTSNS